MTNGRLVILSGPSCVGKSPLAKALAKFYPELRKRLQPLVLYNSRDPRPGEVDGVDYHFRSREQTENFRAKDHFLVMDVRGDLQALDLQELSASLAKGDVFFEENPFVGRDLQTSPALTEVKRLSVFMSPLSRDEILFLKAEPRRVAVLGEEANAFSALDFKNLQAPASALGLQLHHIEVRSPNDFESAFSKITKSVGATALFLQSIAMIITNRKRIADLATKHRLPAIHQARELAEAGILMSYGSDWFDLGRRTATYVDKILKGAKPAELPVEQPTKFELVINLKTAKQIGLTIPPEVLARANRLIK